MEDHDSNYKRLFSHPQMIESLLRDFVKEDWVEKIDFASLSKSNSSYVSYDLRDRSDDIIWKLNIQGEPVYIYLLLEFQSTVDQHMALRVMIYLGLLYQDLLAQKKDLKPSDRLPPVFPIVIYNGEREWTAPLEIAELIADFPGHLSQYVPHYRYFLLDESAEAAKGGEHLQGLMGDVIHLENCEDPKQLELAIDRLRQHLRGPSFDSLRRAFKGWIESTLIKRVAKDEKTVEYRNLDEIQSMLAERVERWTQEWERKGIKKGIDMGIDMGIEKGREEGIDMGRLDERKKLLIKILTSRYGNIEAYLERIQNADLDQLEIWLDQSLGSCSLQEIFT